MGATLSKPFVWAKQKIDATVDGTVQLYTNTRDGIYQGIENTKQGIINTKRRLIDEPIDAVVTGVIDRKNRTVNAYRSVKQGVIDRKDRAVGRVVAVHHGVVNAKNATVNKVYAVHQGVVDTKNACVNRVVDTKNAVVNSVVNTKNAVVNTVVYTRDSVVSRVNAVCQCCIDFKDGTVNCICSVRDGIVDRKNRAVNKVCAVGQGIVDRKNRAVTSVRAGCQRVVDKKNQCVAAVQAVGHDISERKRRAVNRVLSITLTRKQKFLYSFITIMSILIAIPSAVILNDIFHGNFEEAQYNALHLWETSKESLLIMKNYTITCGKGIETFFWWSFANARSVINWLLTWTEWLCLQLYVTFGFIFRHVVSIAKYIGHHVYVISKVIYHNAEIVYNYVVHHGSIWAKFIWEWVSFISIFTWEWTKTIVTFVCRWLYIILNNFGLKWLAILLSYLMKLLEHLGLYILSWCMIVVEFLQHCMLSIVGCFWQITSRVIQITHFAIATAYVIVHDTVTAYQYLMETYNTYREMLFLIFVGLITLYCSGLIRDRRKSEYDSDDDDYEDDEEEEKDRDEDDGDETGMDADDEYDAESIRDGSFDLSSPVSPDLVKEGLERVLKTEFDFSTGPEHGRSLSQYQEGHYEASPDYHDQRYTRSMKSKQERKHDLEIMLRRSRDEDLDDSNSDSTLSESSQPDEIGPDLGAGVDDSSSGNSPITPEWRGDGEPLPGKPGSPDYFDRISEEFKFLDENDEDDENYGVEDLDTGATVTPEGSSGNGDENGRLGTSIVTRDVGDADISGLSEAAAGDMSESSDFTTSRYTEEDPTQDDDVNKTQVPNQGDYQEGNISEATTPTDSMSVEPEYNVTYTETVVTYVTRDTNPMVGGSENIVTQSTSISQDSPTRAPPGGLPQELEGYQPYSYSSRYRRYNPYTSK